MHRLLPVVLLTLIAACASSPTAPGTLEECEGFGDWRASPYVLPYPAGAAYRVDQGNCSAPGNGHRGVTRFGYDFQMPIGSPITAARGGTVIHVEQSHFDGQVAAAGFDNWIVLLHDDGTTGLYGHITHDGATVVEGQVIAQGTLIGRSGNTGNTANKPHLHFSVAPCDPVGRGTAACPTSPLNFRNTDENPKGLVEGRSYVAGL
jgi:murein DD-endopeptidase MepM/ murein hydrolase activator NlpD